MVWSTNYAASTAVTLITGITGNPGTEMFLGMTGVMGVIYICIRFPSLLILARCGSCKKFLNFAGPAVYVVMVLLMIVIWFKAGGSLLSEVGNIFSGGNVLVDLKV